ncbi:hypothetical protein JCM10213_006094 [Rhodosporidiobolus nylandii]
MSAQQAETSASGNLDELLALRERLTRDLKASKGGKGKAATAGEQQHPLDYPAAFALILSFASSLPAAVAAQSGGKHAKGPVPTTAAFEALDLLLRRALSVLTADPSPFPSENPFVHECCTAQFLSDLAQQLYANYEHHLPSAQQKLKPSLSSILALASPAVLDFPPVAAQLRAKVLVDRWDSKRTLHTFEALLGRPGASVAEFGEFAVGEGAKEEGVVRRFTDAMVENEEMAQLIGKVAIAWVEKCWAEQGAFPSHGFWIRPALAACKTGGAKARHSIATYIFQPVFAKRKEAFREVLREGGLLFDVPSSGAGGAGFEKLDEEDLETALSVLKAGNALNLVELDASASPSPAADSKPSPKVAVPSALLLTCIYHSSLSLRISALSLLVLAPSSSVAFPLPSFSLLTAFYTYSLGEEDGEMKMSTVSLTGKLLLRLRDSAWKAHRTAKKGKEGASAAAEYVEAVKTWMQAFLDLVGRELLDPARPFRIKINALRMLDLAFQARVDGRYQLDDEGAPVLGEEAREGAAKAPRSNTTGYSTYRKTATTQTPMFHAKHRKLEQAGEVAPSSPEPTAPAAVDESGWPFALSLVTPSTTQVLLRQLLSTYTSLRFLALSMLERFPAPLPGYEGAAGAEKAKRELLLPALRMIRSGREAEASAGAGVMGLIWRKWVLESLGKGEERWTPGEVGGWQEGAETKRGPEGFAFISSLLDLTEQQLSHYSSNLAEAAGVAPMHGTILALRHLFISIPIASYDALSTPEERRALFHRALGVIRRVWEVTSPVLAARAPEGQDGKAEDDEAQAEADTEEARAIRFEKKEGAAADEDGEDLADGTGGPQHKIILSACWRAMKEAGELLETILRLPSELGTSAFRQIWSYEEIRAIGDLYGVWLARIRHRGAFMACHPCYTRTAAALLVAGKEWPEVGKLPEEWLDGHLDAIVSKRISFTRRSAGIPYLILGLLLTILPSSRSTFDRAFSRLFEIAESTTPDISDESRVHAMNTLRTVFLDAKGGMAAAPFVERGFLVAISLFFSPNWILRNVAMMLFASLTTRALNARRTNLDRDPGSLARRLSVDEFFGRYPALRSVLRQQLERAWKESLEDSPSSNLHSSLFSILMLLSLLQTPKRVESAPSEPSLVEPFIPLVKQCASSRVWKIREVAGDALTGLVAPNEVAAVCEELLLGVERELGGLSQNELHGQLLQLQSLLEGAEPLTDDDETRVSAAYLRLASILLPSASPDQPSRLQHSFAVLTSFLAIVLRLPSALFASDASSPSSLCASYLSQAERWDASALHLPSAQEFLRVCWKVVYAAAAAAADRRRRRVLAVAGLTGRSLEVKRTALEEVAAELDCADEGVDDSECAQALLRVVLDKHEAGDVRVTAAELLRSPRLARVAQGSFSQLHELYQQTPIVPLREAVLPVLAGAAASEEEQIRALQLIDESSVPDQSVEARESAGLALVCLSRILGPRDALPTSQRAVFAHVALRLLQDDDVTARSYAHEAFGLRVVEGKAVEMVLSEGGDELKELVLKQEEEAFETDLSVLANPSSLLFAIEKPNIFLNPFLVPSYLSVSTLPSFAAGAAPAQLDQLAQAVEQGKGLEEGPLGRGGNEVVRRWEGVLLPRAGRMQDE